MSSAICFNLDQSRILSSGDGLKYKVGIIIYLSRIDFVVLKINAYNSEKSNLLRLLKGHAS